MTNPIIQPTVGRVVWFHLSKHRGPTSFTRQPGEQPCAAIITSVLDDGRVNLSVFDSDGAVHSFRCVELVQEGQPVPSYPYCELMPYQKGQATKAEAAKKSPIHVDANSALVYALIGVGAKLSGAPSINLPVLDPGADWIEREIQRKSAAAHAQFANGLTQGDGTTADRLHALRLSEDARSASGKAAEVPVSLLLHIFCLLVARLPLAGCGAPPKA